MAGCLIRGRRRWSVTYTSPRGLSISEFFRIWNRRAFQERKPYQFPGWMKNSPYYCPGRGANPRPPAHPDFITSGSRVTQEYTLHTEAHFVLDSPLPKAKLPLWHITE